MLLLAIVPIHILKGLADCTEGHASCCTIVQARRAYGNTVFSLCVRLMEPRPRSTNEYFGCCIIVLLILATLCVVTPACPQA